MKYIFTNFFKCYINLLITTVAVPPLFHVIVAPKPVGSDQVLDGDCLGPPGAESHCNQMREISSVSMCCS